MRRLKAQLMGMVSGKSQEPLDSSFLPDSATTAPVVRNTSSACSDAVGVLHCGHTRSGDVPTAYLQGDQTASEQVLARPPYDFREHNERGVEILWLMNFPLYGQVDAGAIWNRTFNHTMVGPRGGTSSSNVTKPRWRHAMRRVAPQSTRESKLGQEKSAGLGAERCSYDPCVYGRVVNNNGLSAQCCKVSPRDCRSHVDLLGCCLTFPTEDLLDCAKHTLVYLGRSRKLGTTIQSMLRTRPSCQR